MLRLIFLLPLSFLFSCNSQTKNEEEAQATSFYGSYDANLLLPGNEGDLIGFGLEIDLSGISVINGKELIDVKEFEVDGDSIFFDLPVYDAVIKLRVEEGKLHGEWRKYELAGKDYALYLSAIKKNEQKSVTGLPSGLEGRWQLEFGEGEDAYPAVGIFEEDQEAKLNGTILTETGDYRYLNGWSKGTKLYLQTFDGAHAFLFKAEVFGDSVKGTFRSGPSYKVSFKGTKDKDAKLREASSLTELKDVDALRALCFTDRNGNEKCLKDTPFKDKPLIVQILGSWCPNCRDEALLFQEFYENYHTDGLEIVALAYEYARDTAKAYQSIEKMQRHLGLEYEVLYAGYANKQEASENLWMLSEILSFPTAIFLGSDGKVKAVHTGFSGPGTGEVYDLYKRELDSLVKSLL